MNQNEQMTAWALLIAKHISGCTSKEEEALLNQWRQANPNNEAAFQRLTDPHQMDLELKRRRMQTHLRPMEDMKRRLQLEATSKPSHRWWENNRLWMSVAAVLLLLCCTLLYLREIPRSPLEPTTVETTLCAIQPGRTQATLTLDDGQHIALGSDKGLNRKAIAQAAKGREVKFNNLTTPRGGEFKIVLEDSTEVWLNADSRLRYPEKFSNKERRVEVTGEAYFKVAHSEERPFYVVCGSQEVRVYGTEFNIHAYSDEAEIFTTLVSGSIALRTTGGNQSELLLTPGHQVVFNKDSVSATIREVNTEVVTAWRKGAFVFEEQTLEQIMRTMSRWYDFSYRFADAQVAQEVFMGSIPRYSSFEEVADIFRKIGGIALEWSNGEVVISAHDDHTNH